MKEAASALPAIDAATGRPVDTSLDVEIPTTVLPEIKNVCPVCALEIKAGRERCPRCGIPLKGGTETPKPAAELPLPVVSPLPPPSPIVAPLEPQVPPPPPEKVEPLLAPPEPMKPVEPSPEIVSEVEAKAPPTELPPPAPPIEAPPPPSVVSEEVVKPSLEIVGEKEAKETPAELPAPPPVAIEPPPTVVPEEPAAVSLTPSEAEALPIEPVPEKPIEQPQEKEGEAPAAESPPEIPPVVTPVPEPPPPIAPPEEHAEVQPTLAKVEPLPLSEPEKPIETAPEVSGEAEKAMPPEELPPSAPAITEPPEQIVVPEELEVAPPAPEEAEVAEEAPEPEESIEPPKGIVLPPPSEERISSRGLINGRGATNGTGLVNGRGMVNGTGLINGTGMINGTKPGYRPLAHGAGRMAFLKRWQFLAILVAIVIVLPTFIYLSYGRQTVFEADGDFGEWSHVTMFGMQAPASIPEVTVEEWAVKSDSNMLHMYLMTESNVVGTSNVDSFYLFVDSDGNRGTGYSVSNVGADYMLELHGWDQKIESASLMGFDSSTDQFNWTSWSSIDSLAVATKGQKLEATANMPITLTSDSRFLLLAQDNTVNQASSVSYPVPEKGGVLIIEQEAGSGINTLTGLIPSAPSVTLARLTLRCEGSSGTVSSISPVVVGADRASDIADISLSPGDIKTVDVVVDSSGSLPQSFVSTTIISAGVARTFSDLVLIGEPVCAYVASTPTSIQIDGAFGDWVGHTTSDTDSTSIANPNIDMAAVGSVNATDYAAFYVSVQGQAFQGSYAPATRGKPSSQGGGGGPVTPHRKTGEDVFRVYIDSDILNTSGQLVQKGSKVIGADYLLEIDGIDGAIVSRTLMVYNSGEWVQALGTVYAASYSQKVEASVTSASIGGATSFVAIVETTDWRTRSDWAWTGSVLDPWVIDANGTTYMSSDGSTWSYLDKPTLQVGDRVVDIAMTQDETEVFLVTNTGRTYYWTLDSSTSWTPGEIYPIDIANYSEAVSMAFYSSQGASAWLLTKNGSYFWLHDAHKSTKEWTYQNTPLLGYSDYTDLFYAGGTMYAMRSGQNSSLNFSGNGNIFSDVTSPTGSTANQTQFMYLPLTSGRSDDKIYVLCENGDIRYSSDGGSVWSALGDLPVPTGGNTSKYVALGIDPGGYMWVVTDTGYTYRSTDTTTYNNFTCTGQSPIGAIVAILPTTVVVPEFPTVVVPLLAIVFFVVLPRIRQRRQRDT